MLDFDFAYCHGEDGRFHANLDVSLDMSSERVYIHDYGDGPFYTVSIFLEINLWPNK